MTMDDLTRRQFLARAGGAAVGTTAFASTLMNLSITRAAAQVGSGDAYKAIVCVFLFGGNDSWNMLVPTSDAEHAVYSASRGGLALPRSVDLGQVGADEHAPLIDLGGELPSGRSFGLHPAMPETAALFDGGHLGFVANVGMLVDPIDRSSQVTSGSVRVPLALYSHSDQQLQWLNASPAERVTSGWGGRIGESLRAVAVPANIPTNISTFGQNQWQQGTQARPYVIASEGSFSIKGSRGNGFSLRDDRVRFESIAEASGRPTFDSQAGAYTNRFRQAYLDELVRSTELHTEFAAAFDRSPLSATFQGGFEEQLAAVAASIAAREQLGMARQIFFVGIGGWDQHGELLGAHADKLATLSRGLGRFWSTLGELGVREQVVTFTGSDFGRTLVSNGNGTDHAWGGNQIVMGGPVVGGQIHGDYPTLLVGDGAESLDVDTNGRLFPTTSLDAFAGELAMWFGVPAGDLDSVLPNNADHRFFDPATNRRPVGFISDLAGESEPLSASIETSCLNGDGRVDIEVVNGDDVAHAFEVAFPAFPNLNLTRTVAAGASLSVTRTGRRDGPLAVEVYRLTDEIGNPTRVLVTSYDVAIACDPAVGEASYTQSCLADRGRIDVLLANATSTVQTYRVVLERPGRPTGLSPRIRSVPAGGQARVTITGRPDGRYRLTVDRVGAGGAGADAVILDEAFDVACASPAPNDALSQASVSCLSGNGLVRVDLFNPGVSIEPLGFEVRVGSLAPQLVTVANAEQATVRRSGRPDGPIDVVVTTTNLGQNRTERHTVVVACDL